MHPVLVFMQIIRGEFTFCIRKGKAMFTLRKKKAEKSMGNLRVNYVHFSCVYAPKTMPIT